MARKLLEKSFPTLEECFRYLNGGRRGRGNLRVRMRGTNAPGIFVPRPSDSARGVVFAQIQAHFIRRKGAGG